MDRQLLQEVFSAFKASKCSHICYVQSAQFFGSTLMLLSSINVVIPSLDLVKTLNSVPHLYFFSHIGFAGSVANAVITAKFFAGLIYLSSLLISARILK